ncbi:MAG: PQQ-binding-like beta-propeller repeat protein [Fimbriimonas sp.]|nr:PQQ-binding-like beta-propeller repeat protein [Fimbriimonas sp.]
MASFLLACAVLLVSSSSMAMAFGATKQASPTLSILDVFMDDQGTSASSRIGREVLAPGGLSGNQRIHVIVLNSSLSAQPTTGTLSLVTTDVTGATNSTPGVSMRFSLAFKSGTTDVWAPATAVFPDALVNPAQFGSYSFNGRLFQVAAKLTAASQSASSFSTTVNLDGLGVPDWMWDMRLAYYSTPSGLYPPFPKLWQPSQMWNPSYMGAAQSDLQTLDKTYGFNTFLVGEFFKVSSLSANVNNDYFAFLHTLSLSGAIGDYLSHHVWNPSGGGFTFPSVSYSFPPTYSSIGAIQSLVGYIHALPGTPHVIAYTDPSVLSVESIGAPFSPYTKKMYATKGTDFWGNPVAVPFRAVETMNLASFWLAMCWSPFRDYFNYVGDDEELPDVSVLAVLFPEAAGIIAVIEGVIETINDIYNDLHLAYQADALLNGYDFDDPPRFLSEVAGDLPNFGPAYQSASASDISNAVKTYGFDAVLADDTGRPLQKLQTGSAAVTLMSVALVDVIDIMSAIASQFPLHGLIQSAFENVVNTLVSIGYSQLDSFALSVPVTDSPLYATDAGTDWNGISATTAGIRSGIKTARGTFGGGLISSDYFDVWTNLTPTGKPYLPAQALAEDVPSTDQYALFSTAFATTAYDARRITRKPFRTDTKDSDLLLGGLLYNSARARSIETGLAWAQGTTLENSGDALLNRWADTSVQQVVQSLNSLRAQRPNLFDSPSGAVNASPMELCFHSFGSILAQIPSGQVLKLSSSTHDIADYGLNKIVTTAYRQTLVTPEGSSAPNSTTRRYTIFLVNTMDRDKGRSVGSGTEAVKLTISLNSPEHFVSGLNALAYVPQGSGYNMVPVSIGQGSSSTVTVPVDTVTVLQFYTQVATVSNNDVVLDPLSSFFVTPTSVVGGATVHLTVGISTPAPVGGVTVSLSSSLPGVAPIVASITIPAGQSIAVVNVQTTPIQYYAEVTFTASNLGTSLAATLTVSKGPSLSVTPWPKFRASQTNGGLSSGSGSGGSKLWAYGSGLSTSSPVVGAKGVVYFTGQTNGPGYFPYYFNLYRITDGVGKALFTGGASWGVHYTGDLLFNSTPALANDGTVYFGTWDGNLYAVSSDGSKKWAFQTGGDIDSSPAIGPDGTVYIASTDHSLYAIDPATGSRKWAFPTGGLILSSPAIGLDGTIYIGSYDKRWYAVDPLTGLAKWSLLTQYGIDTSAAIGPDGTVYFGSSEGNLYAIDPKTAARKWTSYCGFGGIVSSPAIGPDGTIYVGSSDFNLYAINPKDGSQKWVFPTGGLVYSSPAVGADGIIYLYTVKGLCAIDPAHGELRWSYAGASSGFERSPAIGSGGTVYITDGSGNLFALDSVASNTRH